MTLRPDVDELLRSLGAAAVWLFGSRARGDARPDSDADVAVLLRTSAPDPGLLAQGQLAVALGEVLDAPAVDVVVLDRASLALRGRVLTEGRLLWSADDPRRVRFTVETLSRYFDVLPAIREQDRAYIAAVAGEGL